MSRAQQLDLMVSLTTSVTLQADIEKAEAYAQKYSDRANALAEENDGLKARLLQVKAALHAEQARIRDLERELTLTRLLVESLETQVALSRWAREQAPRRALDKDTLTQLVKLCHPDRWQGQPAETLAHEVMVVLNNLREQVGGQV